MTSIRVLEFRKNEGGAAAIEFAVLVVPTVLLMMVMVYFGLLRYAQSILDTNMETVLYKAYSGVPICSGSVGSAAFPYDADCLKKAICEESSIVFVSSEQCKTKAKIDVRTLSEASSQTYPPMFQSGKLVASSFTNETGIADGRVVMVRMAMPYPNFAVLTPAAPQIGIFGERLLMSSMAFRSRDLTVYQQPTN